MLIALACKSRVKRTGTYWSGEVDPETHSILSINANHSRGKAYVEGNPGADQVMTHVGKSRSSESCLESLRSCFEISCVTT